MGLETTAPTLPACTAVVLRPSYTFKTKSGANITLEQGDGDVGGFVWAGALVLSRYLEAHADIVRGKRVLELGAGTGLVGLVCAVLGANDVLLTDGFEHVVRRLEHNVQCARSIAPMASVQLLNWTNGIAALAGRTYDVIVGADVIYKKQHVGPFLDTVAAASHRGTELIVANGDRTSVRHFLNAAVAQGYHVKKIDPAPYLCSGGENDRLHFWRFNRI